jgi:hypothetical protein
MIEQHNPHIQFDWTRILKGQPEPGEVPERRERPRPDPGHKAAAAAALVPDSLPDTPAPDTPAQTDLPGDEVTDELGAPASLQDDGPITAAHARLGSEGVSRLRARYADIMAGITDRIHDPQRAAELKIQAERLNPDCWVTDDEVRQGLEQYESVFDSLRSVVGRRRRRRRR